MKLRQFASLANFDNKIELDRILLTAFHQLTFDGKDEFDLREVINILYDIGYPKPNLSRLKNNISTSKKFIKGSQILSYKIHSKEFSKLKESFPEITIKSEEIIASETILPETLFLKTRGYIENLSKQINACYENNLFDACAVLMRRVVEILLIHSYEHIGRINEIEDVNGMKNLNTIINYTLSNKVIRLSKESAEILDIFRQLGNFSAHKIQYNCKREDINKVKLQFRLIFEELIYAAGIRK